MGNRKYIDFKLIEKVPNKYNIKPGDIKKLNVLDWDKLKKNTWYNDAMKKTGEWYCHLEGSNGGGFYGDDEDNRYKEISKSVENFMDDVANRNIAKKRILEKLQLKFQRNASKKDVNITLTKENIVWCIIAVICNCGNEFLTDEMIDEEFDGDYGLRDSVKETYGFVIEDSSHKFQLISKVLAEYQKYKMQDKTKKYEDFIKANWALFTSFFPDVEPDQQKMLIYMILGKIFNNQSVINNIRENVGGV